MKYKDVEALIKENHPELYSDFSRFKYSKFIASQLMVMRSSNDVSQLEMANFLGVTQSKVSKIESSKDSDLTIADMLLYCKKLGYNLTIEIDKDDWPESISKTF